MPVLFHCTHRRNLASIRRYGLLTSYARQGLQAVWAVTARRLGWAIRHVTCRHGGMLEDVVVLAVKIGRKRLRRFKRCIWYTLADVAPERMVSISSLTLVGVQ